MALGERKFQDAYVDGVDPELECTLVLQPSAHSPTGILMQRKDNTLQWIFYHTEKKIKDLYRNGF